MQYRHPGRFPRVSASVVAALSLMAGSAAAKPPTFAETSYAGSGWMSSDGRTTRFEQHVDWQHKRIRMAMTPEGGNETTVIVYDMRDGSGLLFGVGENLPAREKVAIRTDTGDTYEQMRSDFDALGEMQALGQRTVHGESCTLYRSEIGGVGDEEDEPGIACITADGIPVQYLDADQDTAVMELTSVTRGPQPPSLFEVPAGYQTMDTSNLGSMFSGLMGGGEADAAGMEPAREAPPAEADDASEAAGPGQALREGLRGLFNRRND